MNRTVKWLLIIGALITWGLIDFTSTIATCDQKQRQKAEQSAEEGCGFTDSLTFRTGENLTKWIDDRHDFVSAAAALAVAIFTFTLWRATDKLWAAGERQLEHLSVTAERQLRAYVNVTRVTVKDFGLRARYFVEIKNYGQTPAYRTALQVAVNLIGFPVVGQLPDVPPAASSKVLAPGASDFIVYETEQVLTYDQRQEIERGNSAVFVHGSITYVDAFNRNQWTTFRYYTGGDAPHRIDGNLAVAKEGNEAS
jgi:hypothetical protein